MTIEDIKNWLDEAIDFFVEVAAKNGCSRDIQENIKSNRKLFGASYRKREEIKAWVVANKPTALPYLVELATWMRNYYHYFDTGFRSEWSIDVLPGLIKERLEFLREKIESL